jgi:hypothetical protein
MRITPSSAIVGEMKNRCGKLSLDQFNQTEHIAAHDIGYVTNGVFIAEGFNVRRINDSNPNAWFNISSAAWKGRVRM